MRSNLLGCSHTASNAMVPFSAHAAFWDPNLSMQGLRGRRLMALWSTQKDSISLRRNARLEVLLMPQRSLGDMRNRNYFIMSPFPQVGRCC